MSDETRAAKYEAETTLPVGMDVLSENEIELLAIVRENEGIGAEEAVKAIISDNPALAQYRRNMLNWCGGLSWKSGYKSSYAIAEEDDETDFPTEEEADAEDAAIVERNMR